jgi:hypothetical protein
MSEPIPPGPHYQRPVPPQKPAGGGTAISAAVLSLLGSVAQGYPFVTSTLEMGSNDEMLKHLPGWWHVYVLISWVLSFILTVGLLVGGIQLLRRRDYARRMIIGACGIVIFTTVFGTIMMLAMRDKLAEYAGVSASFLSTVGIVGGLIVLIFPIVTLVLTILPPTKRWCAQGAP